jgi:hypothetical protein
VTRRDVGPAGHWQVTHHTLRQDPATRCSVLSGEKPIPATILAGENADCSVHRLGVDGPQDRLAMWLPKQHFRQLHRFGGRRGHGARSGQRCIQGAAIIDDTVDHRHH